MGALNGIKILDFTTLLPGPYATMLMADLGADVLRVSSKNRSDLVVEMPPLIEGTETSAASAWLGRNKRNMYLDLKRQEAKNIILKLVQKYDVVIEQFRPGVMKRLGLSYEDLKKVKPDIIYCSLSGYGQDGVLSSRAGHDINYLSRSGVMSASGRNKDGISLTSMQIADVAAGAMNSVVGILSAVIYRNSTGKGQYIDIAMLDGLIPFNAMSGAGFLVGAPEPKREGELLNGGSVYDFYRTKDGRYLSVGSLEPKFFAELCRATGLDEYSSLPVSTENAAVVKERLREKILQKTLAEWTEIFKNSDACVEPVLNLDEALLNDEHIKQRKMVVNVEMPTDKGVSVKQLGNPIKLSECPPQYRHAGYPLGYHTDEVMCELGFSPEEINKYKSDGIFG